MKPREWATLLLLLALCLTPLAVGLSQLDYPWRWFGAEEARGERTVYVVGAFDFVLSRTADGGRQAGPLLKGLGVTLVVSLAALVIALPLGIALGVAGISPNRGLATFTRLYVELFRSSPLLIQIYLMYYVVGMALEMPLRGLSIWSEYRAAALGALALALFSAAYIAEIVRGGILALPAGQTEAARALGLSRWQSLRHVILPQALIATLPALAGQFVNLVKDSSLLSVIGVMELLKQTRESFGSSYLTFELVLLSAVLYLIITLPLSAGVRALERRCASPR